MNAKQLMVGILLASALLVLAHAPLSGQQSDGRYDPWLDYDEDGDIDVNELRQLGEAYGSTGNPTKNVTVADHATEYIRVGGGNISVQPYTNWLSDIIPTDGYAKVTILVFLSPASNRLLNIFAIGNEGYSWFVETVDPNGDSWVKTYDVMGSGIQIRIDNPNPSLVRAEVGFYLIA